MKFFFFVYETLQNKIDNFSLHAKIPDFHKLKFYQNKND